MDRFWSKVDKSGDCWEWLASKTHNGYGQFRRERGSMSRAHRYVLEMNGVKIPPKMEVCHHCDNPGCVNPEHLFIGTRANNVRDKIRKHRQPRGEAVGGSKLTEEDVRWIRQIGASPVKIAKCFGISQSLIGFIRRRDIWKHVA